MCPKISARNIRLTVGALVLIAHFRNNAPDAAALDNPPEVRSQGAEQQDLLKEAERLREQARELQMAGQLAKAGELYEKILVLERTLYGQEHETIANTLDQVAELYLEFREFSRARQAWQQVLRLRTKLYGQDHYSVTDARLDLAEVDLRARLTQEDLQRLLSARASSGQSQKLQAEGKPLEALPLAQKALAIQRELAGDSQRNTLMLLNNLGMVLHDLGRYEEALRLLEQVVDLRKKQLGEMHPETARALNNLGYVLTSYRRTAEARPRYEEALAIYRKVRGENHRDTAIVLDNLGVLLRHQEDYVAARPYLEKALAIRRKELGQYHRETAYSITNLGLLLQDLGDYSAARPYFNEALAIQAKVLGEDHPHTALAFGRLGALLQDQGDYAAARQCLERALAIHRTACGEKHRDTAASLLNLGGLLQAQGDYATALPYYNQAVSIFEEVLGRGHGDTAAGFINLGQLLRRLERLEEARPYLEEGLATIRKVYGENHRYTGSALLNMGLLLKAEKNYEAALPYFKQTLDIWKKAYGNEHPKVATAISNLATLLFAKGDSDAAQPYLKECLAICNNALGDSHPYTAMSLDNQGRALLMQKEYSSARRYFEQALTIERKLAWVLMSTLSEAEALTYVETTRFARSPLLSALRLLEAKPQEAYEPVWQTRALATRALAARCSLAHDHEVPQAKPIREQLQSVRAQLAKLSRALPAPEQVSARRQRLADLTSQKERLERQLAEVSDSFRRKEHIENVGFRDLVAILPRKTAVVDLVQTAFMVPSGPGGALAATAHYEAFVLRPAEPSSGGIAWIHLGPAEPIDQAVHAWREKLIPGAVMRQQAEAPERTLRKLVWEPLEAHLTNCSTIVILPDGALTRVPWAALPGKHPGSFLLEEYAIGTANHGLEVYDLLTRPPTQGERALLVGGAQYDKAPEPAVASHTVVAHRGVVHGGKTPIWPYLAGSLQETEQVASLYSRPDKAVMLKGSAASAAALCEQLPRARYVHLATHGFFADSAARSILQQEAGEQKLLLGGQEMSGHRSTVRGRNPLILSGLVLAGANVPPAPTSWGAPLGDDGILTAEELAGLDLRETEMVVLSACETGLGEVAGGEGVFGLQRAFALAGARAVIASLWKVDDHATQALMAEFYRNLWQKKLGKLEALRQAQLSVLTGYDPKERRLRGPGAVSPAKDPEASAHAQSELRKQGNALPPSYWAGFVLSGDWR